MRTLEAVASNIGSRTPRTEIVRGSLTYRVLMAAGVAGTVLVAVGLPFVVSSFTTFEFSLAIAYAIGVLGLNVLTGYTGQISLGHSVFFGLGAYTGAILIGKHGWNYLLAIPVVVVVCLLAGLLIGIPAVRLSGIYLVLLTLSVAVAWPDLLTRFTGLTGGSAGIFIPIGTASAPGWTGLSDGRFRYLLALVLLVVAIGITRNLVNGRVGRAFTAIRDNEVPAVALGVNIAFFKVTSFGLSSMFAGLAGFAYLLLVQYVSPDSFVLLLSITFLTGMVVGGAGSVYGAVFGGLFIEFAQIYTQDVNQSLTGLVYGVVLIVFMFIMPTGFTGLLGRLSNRVVTLVEPAVEPSNAIPDLADTTLFSEPTVDAPRGGAE